jgi:hypothetical protein
MISAARRHAPSICAGLFRSIACARRVAHRIQEDGFDRLEHGIVIRAKVRRRQDTPVWQ